jgi:tetratricopeptide (TPR) repeat protein
MMPESSKRSNPGFQKGDNSAPAWIALTFCLVLAVGGCIHPAPAPTPPNLPGHRLERRDPYIQGLRNYREGFFESAIREFKKVPADHPRYKQSQNYLEKAAEKIMEAGRHVNDALAMKSKGEFLEAKTQLEAAVEIYPRNRNIQALLEAVEEDIDATTDYYYENGMKELERKNMEQAKENFRAAMKTDPEDDRASGMLLKVYLEEGNAFFQKGDFDGSIKSLESAYSVDSSDPALIDQLTNAYNRRALKLYREEKFSDAIRDLDRSLKIKSDQREIQVQLKQAQERMELLKKIGP